MAQRIQLRRTKGWRLPAGAVKVDRTTRWGNPWPVDSDFDAAAVVELYAAALEGRFLWQDDGLLVTPEMVVEHLAGHDLACWCPLTDAAGNRVPCHADVLLDLANR